MYRIPDCNQGRRRRRIDRRVVKPNNRIRPIPIGECFIDNVRVLRGGERVRFIEKPQKKEVNRPCPCYKMYFPIICCVH